MMSSERSTRVSRVERELFVTLAQFLQHDLSLPLPCYAAITAVDTSPDLRHARVFFRLVGKPEQTAEAISILDEERKAFQQHVARELRMKFCPVLKFEYGLVPEKDEVDVLLENLHKPRYGYED